MTESLSTLKGRVTSKETLLGHQKRFLKKLKKEAEKMPAGSTLKEKQAQIKTQEALISKTKTELEKAKADHANAVKAAKQARAKRRQK